MPPRFSLFPRLYAFAVMGLLVVAAFAVRPAQAQLSSSTALFLRIEPDSRSAAMGNAGVALADNANAMFWNPAGLAFQTNSQIGLTHANWLPEFDAGLFYEYLVGTYHVPDIGTFGGHVTFLNLGEIEVRDVRGQEIRVDRSYELAVGGSYGLKLSERFGLGTNVRFIYSKLTGGNIDIGEGGGNIESGTASTISFDLAGLYRTPEFGLGSSDATFSAGFNLANMGGHMTYNEEEQALPTNLRLGYALTVDFDEYNSLTFANDFNKELVRIQFREVEGPNGTTREVAEPDPFYQAIFTSWRPLEGERVAGQDPEELGVLQQFTVGLGLEYWYSGLFALRTGYFYEDPNNGDRQFLTFGAGLRYNIVGLDISYLFDPEDESPLANTLRFSLLLDFK